MWNGATGFRGDNIKIAIIDTGLDYTHANFGGPGTVAAYMAANAADTLPANPAHFGPNAPKVKGGIDLVGDDYNASAPAGSPALVPHPDPNPLDCNGHGSHVGGSAAGFGVLADGTTYGDSPTETYDPSTFTPGKFRIGPGVAPRAHLYGVRVFGCLGSTNVTVDAIEWAVDNGMDVINMSLGSAFGTNDDPSSVASTNAAKAGVMVITSAGNNGANQYITGSPGVADGIINTAASDSSPSFPGFSLALSTGPTVTAINANGHNLAATATYNVKVIANDMDTPVDESLGCNVSDYGTVPANTVVVVVRGLCARVGKAISRPAGGRRSGRDAQHGRGPAAVRGRDLLAPGHGRAVHRHDPLHRGSRRPRACRTGRSGQRRRRQQRDDARQQRSADKRQLHGLRDVHVGRPAERRQRAQAGHHGAGREHLLDRNGTGNAPGINSGTSMASPHVAGVAALVKQAHPGWKTEDLHAAIVNTGNPGAIGGTAPTGSAAAERGSSSPSGRRRRRSSRSVRRSSSR